MTRNGNLFRNSMGMGNGNSDENGNGDGNYYREIRGNRIRNQDPTQGTHADLSLEDTPEALFYCT